MASFQCDVNGSILNFVHAYQDIPYFLNRMLATTNPIFESTSPRPHHIPKADPKPWLQPETRPSSIPKCESRKVTDIKQQPQWEPGSQVKVLTSQVNSIGSNSISVMLSHFWLLSSSSQAGRRGVCFLMTCRQLLTSSIQSLQVLLCLESEMQALPPLPMPERTICQTLYIFISGQAQVLRIFISDTTNF